MLVARAPLLKERHFCSSGERDRVAFRSGAGVDAEALQLGRMAVAGDAEDSRRERLVALRQAQRSLDRGPFRGVPSRLKGQRSSFVRRVRFRRRHQNWSDVRRVLRQLREVLHDSLVQGPAHRAEQFGTKRLALGAYEYGPSNLGAEFADVAGPVVPQKEIQGGPADPANGPPVVRRSLPGEYRNLGLPEVMNCTDQLGDDCACGCS